MDCGEKLDLNFLLLNVKSFSSNTMVPLKGFASGGTYGLKFTAYKIGSSLRMIFWTTDLFNFVSPSSVKFNVYIVMIIVSIYSILLYHAHPCSNYIMYS